MISTVVMVSYDHVSLRWKHTDDLGIVQGQATTHIMQILKRKLV